MKNDLYLTISRFQSLCHKPIVPRRGSFMHIININPPFTACPTTLPASIWQSIFHGECVFLHSLGQLQLSHKVHPAASRPSKKRCTSLPHLRIKHPIFPTLPSPGQPGGGCDVRSLALLAFFFLCNFIFAPTNPNPSASRPRVVMLCS